MNIWRSTLIRSTWTQKRTWWRRLIMFTCYHPVFKTAIIPVWIYLVRKQLTHPSGCGHILENYGVIALKKMLVSWNGRSILKAVNASQVHLWKPVGVDSCSLPQKSFYDVISTDRMSEGDSVGDSIHGKPSVVSAFFTRIGQVSYIYIYIHQLDYNYIITRKCLGKTGLLLICSVCRHNDDCSWMLKQWICLKAALQLL